MSDIRRESITDLQQQSLELLKRLVPDPDEQAAHSKTTASGHQYADDLAAAKSLLVRVRERGEIEFDVGRRLSLQRLLDRWRLAAGDIVDFPKRVRFELALIDERYRDTSALGRVTSGQVEPRLKSGRALVGAIIADRFDPPPLPTRFVDCRFIGSNLRQLVFYPDSSFIRCSFEDVDLSRSSLEHVSFSDCVLSDASLVGANLRGSAFLYSALKSVDLKGASCRGMILAQSSVSSSTVDRSTDLCEVFFGPDTLLADLAWAEADLRGAYFWQVVVRGTELDRCRLDGARLGWVSGHGFRFKEVSARQSLVLECPLAGMTIDGGDWSAARFHDCIEVDRLRGIDRLRLDDRPIGSGFVVPGRGKIRRRRDPVPVKTSAPEVTMQQKSGTERPGGPTALPPDPWKAEWILEAIHTGRPLVSIEINRRAAAALRSLGDTPVRFIDCRFSCGAIEAGRFAPGTSFTSCRFDRGTAFRHMSLGGVVFSDCFFDGVAFRDSVVSDTSFINCVLQSCRLVAVDLDRTVLARSLLVDCRFDASTSLRAASISGGTTVEDCTFNSTILSRARFGDVTVRSTAFRDCAMEDALFVGVHSLDCDVRRVDLSGAAAFDSSLPGWPIPSGEPG